MRFSKFIGVLVATAAPATVWAQNIGPSATNPLDTGGGTTVPGTGVSTTGLAPTNQPYVPTNVAPVVAPAVPASPNTPISAPLTVSGRPMLPVNPATSAPPPAMVDTMPTVLRAVPGGLTADGAAERALRNAGPSLQIARANLEIARATAVETARNMLPQLSTVFRYTRLSEYTVPPIIFAGQQITLTPAILNQFDWQTTLAIPLTDIPLRILPNLQAANLQAASAELSLESTRAQTGLEAREAFYEYVRAVGQEMLVNESIAALQRRLEDVRRAVQAGTAARANQLTIEAQVADLQRNAVLAHTAVVINETLVRQRLHLRADETITIGESLDATPEMPTSVTDLVGRAYTTRPEVLAMDRQIEAVDRNIFATRASQFPSISAAGHVDYANPNTRFFPQTQTWQATWDASLQVSWNATTAFVADATISRLRAQQALIAGQQAQLREGIEVQVRQYYQAAQSALALAQSSRIALQSAEENFRVSRERVAAGAAVASDLAQAEVDLLRARLNAINAIIDARLAVARIRRATGEREVVDMHP